MPSTLIDPYTDGPGYVIASGDVAAARAVSAWPVSYWTDDSGQDVWPLTRLLVELF